MLESKVHDIIINNEFVRQGLSGILNIESSTKDDYIHEDLYINGITADFTLTHNDKIKSIIEVKGGNINVTDYVRGIGQVLQYEYFYENNISPKSYPYTSDFKTVLLFPSSVIRENSFNIGKFKYPNTTVLIELNENNNAVREITKEELEKLNSNLQDDVVAISQYYFRDNRIFEYYILLKYLRFLQEYGNEERYNRSKLDNTFLKKINTINNGNWRNAFITLSNLGMIDSNNLPTFWGKTVLSYGYEGFCAEIYNSYLKPYAREIYKCFGDSMSLNKSYSEMKDLICSRYKSRDVLYLTQSSTRYLSSFFNILRDDYGIISFKKRSNHKILKYNPDELKNEAFRNKIKQNSIAYEYIEKYNNLIKNGEF